MLSSGSEQGCSDWRSTRSYAENGRFFVGYTDRQNHDIVERYQVSADPDRGDPATAVTLLSIDDPASNHNGGMVLFGPDGKLWVGFGDGGGGGDTYKNGQNKQTLLGKMLRLDADSGEPYAHPRGQPVRRQHGVSPGDLVDGDAQPVALQLRPRRPAISGSAMSGRTPTRRSTGSRPDRTGHLAG